MPPANSPPANSPTSNACTVSYTYDRSGRLTSANYGQGKLLVYSYDPAGNLLRRTDHFDTYLPLVMRR
jgi:YD repeat-containing protein